MRNLCILMSSTLCTAPRDPDLMNPRRKRVFHFCVNGKVLRPPLSAALLTTLCCTCWHACRIQIMQIYDL